VNRNAVKKAFKGKKALQRGIRRRSRKGIDVPFNKRKVQDEETKKVRGTALPGPTAECVSWKLHDPPREAPNLHNVEAIMLLITKNYFYGTERGAGLNQSGYEKDNKNSKTILAIELMP